jgi:hypothetical protein
MLTPKRKATMQLELNEREQGELIDLLKVAIGEIGSEIHHAMDHETREQYRQQRLVLEGLLNRLAAK